MNIDIKGLDSNSAIIPNTTCIRTTYKLNLEKSLEKKLEASRRIRNFSYDFKDGGVVFEADVATYELFRLTALSFYNDIGPGREINMTKMTDCTGENVSQLTIRVFDSVANEKEYTVNMYHTTSRVMVNGRNVGKFINEDLEKIHEIIQDSLTQSVNIDLNSLNKLIQNELEKLVTAFNKDNTTKKKSSDAEHQVCDITSENKQDNIECTKCKRPCRTKASFCDFGKHWIHYNCEKLDPKEIKTLEQDIDKKHQCKICVAQENEKIVSQITKISPVSADDLLKEDMLTSYRGEDVDACSNCNIIFDTEDLNSECEVPSCFSCIGLEDQHIDSPQFEPIDISIQQTRVKEPEIQQYYMKQQSHSSPNPTNIQFNEQGEITQSNTVPKVLLLSEEEHAPTIALSQTKVDTRHDDQRSNSLNMNRNMKKQNLKNSRLKTQLSPKTNINTPSEIDHQNVIKMTELRQKEVKLRKWEEELKIKDKVIQDNSQRCIRLETYIRKLESEKEEYENTIKTLKRTINMMEESQDRNSIPHKLPPDETISNTKLVQGLQDRVTKYILKQVDKQIEQMEKQVDINNGKTTEHLEIDNRNLDFVPTPTMKARQDQQSNSKVNKGSPVHLQESDHIYQLNQQNITHRMTSVGDQFNGINLEQEWIPSQNLSVNQGSPVYNSNTIHSNHQHSLDTQFRRNQINLTGNSQVYQNRPFVAENIKVNKGSPIHYMENADSTINSNSLSTQTSGYSHLPINQPLMNGALHATPHPLRGCDLVQVQLHGQNLNPPNHDRSENFANRSADTPGQYQKHQFNDNQNKWKNTDNTYRTNFGNQNPIGRYVPPHKRRNSFLM